MIEEWTERIIEGPGGLNAFEEREMVEFHISDRLAACRWTVRCLANPDCKGAAEVMDAIQRRREAILASRPSLVKGAKE